jgi:hypothetical protein
VSVANRPGHKLQANTPRARSYKCPIAHSGAHAWQCPGVFDWRNVTSKKTLTPKQKKRETKELFRRHMQIHYSRNTSAAPATLSASTIGGGTGTERTATAVAEEEQPEDDANADSEDEETMMRRALRLSMAEEASTSTTSVATMGAATGGQQVGSEAPQWWDMNDGLDLNDLDDLLRDSTDSGSDGDGSGDDELAEATALSLACEHGMEEEAPAAAAAVALAPAVAVAVAAAGAPASEAQQV